MSKYINYFDWINFQLIIRTCFCLHVIYSRFCRPLWVILSRLRNFSKEVHPTFRWSRKMQIELKYLQSMHFQALINCLPSLDQDANRAKNNLQSIKSIYCSTSNVLYLKLGYSLSLLNRSISFSFFFFYNPINILLELFECCNRYYNF